MSTYSTKGEINQLDVAVIGMSGRFPGAKDIDIFWQNLIGGIESISTLSDEELLESGVDEDLLRNPLYVKAASWIEGIELFDAQFFGYSPTEAELLDPQGRLLLECAWEALEQGGYSSVSSQKNIGVFVSASINTYLLNNVYDSLDLNRFILGGGNIQVVLGNHNDFIATRLSYKLNLNGPSIDIQTACSSSLVAVHQACQSLMLGECKMALAGGASIYLPQKTGYLYEDGLILSPDGHCRAFDSQANGTVFGRGGGIVLLKPLFDAIADGDEIYAVVKGSAVNNDGSSKAGFTAPSINGQARVISEAISNAGIDPETIGYVEAHGTGTRTGDPIEIAALNQAFKPYTQNKQFCAIGSLKSNIGHLDAASGIAGFIKTVLVLKNGIIPASLHYRAPNPEIDFENSPFYVNSSLRTWDSGQKPRRAGVSSFGMGGTNVHVILESAPELDIVRSSVERPRHILALSARNAQALQELLGRYARHFERHPELLLEDICFTANTGRGQYKHRLALGGNNVAQLCEKAKAILGNEMPDGSYHRGGTDTARCKIAFLFSGQGSQYVNMGRELYETQPIFHRVMEQCDAMLRPHLKIPLLDLLYGGDGAEVLDETAYTQPALFALEYALAQLWCSWGVKPSFVMGHSLGEYVAACVAGVISLEDGLKLVAGRAKLMGSLPTGGAMVAVFADESLVARYIVNYQDTIAIAAINGPTNTVVSGKIDDLNRLVSALEENGIMVRRLAVSHAFHSPLIDPILGKFQAIAEQIDFTEPNIKLISNVSGTLADSEHTRAAYWRDHARHPVRFAAGMKTLEKEGCQLYLEIGPQPVLTGMGMQCIQGDAAWLPSLRKGQDDWAEMIDSLCAIYTHGHNIDWVGFDQDYHRRHVLLPTYPFSRVRHWIEPSDRIKEISKRHTYNDIACKIGHPLLSHRLPTPSLIFESSLRVDSNSWLKDHRLFGYIVFPATGFIEIALAGIREVNGKNGCFFEDVTIERFLTLCDEKPILVQLILTPGKGGSYSFEIFSNSEEDGANRAAWTLNVRGTVRFTGQENGPVGINSPEQIKLRCTDIIPAEDHYNRLLENGLYMGSSFQGIADLWQGSKEAFGKLSLQENVHKESTDYIVHPALLDSCLQVVLAALPNDGNTVNRTGIYVPVAIKKLRIYSSPAKGKWSHARLCSVEGRSEERVEADVWLLDDAGQVLIEICGLQLRRVSRGNLFPATRHNVDEWFFELSWKQMSRLNESTASLEAVFLPEVSQLSHDLESAFDKLSTEHQLAIYRKMAPDFNKMCTAYIIHAFKKMGFIFALEKSFSVESILDELGIIPKHLRLTMRYLDILREDGILGKNGSVWTVVNIPEKADPDELWDTLHKQFPACRNELNYIAQTAPHLAEALTGDVDPLHMLFPSGDLSSSISLYQKTPFALVFNRLIQNAVSLVLKTASKETPVRILEVGSGTGGTTSFVLPYLDPTRTEYCFTDVSPLFLQKASEQFAAYPFVRYQILDIEKDPAKQGFKPAGFDMIIGANVIHATHNLRESLNNIRGLLAPGGIFILLEVTGAQRFADLTVGLLEGWWRFDDFDLRPDYPLLSEDRWRELLIESGFTGAISIPPACESRGDLSQQAVIISNGSSHLPEFNVAVFSGKPIGAWLIFADDEGHGEALGKEICRLGGIYWLVYPGDVFSKAANRYKINPDDPADFERLLYEVTADHERPLSKVVVMWAMNHRLEAETTLDKLEVFQRISCGGTVYLLQKLIGMGFEELPTVTLVTKGAVATNSYEDLPCPAATTLWGLGRVVTLEHPELRFNRIDLDPFCQAEGTQWLSDLLEEILVPDREDQVAFRNNQRFVARLAPCTMGGDREIPLPEAQVPFQLKIPDTGVLDEMKYEQTERKMPGPGEVAIRIDAAGLNFKDVMAALKMYPGDPGAMGKECSGVIVACGEDVTHLKAGDEVIALTTGCFANEVVVSARLVVTKPRELSFEQAASIPVNFITAKYALDIVGKLKKGERILIHAAAGGVGHAAVQLASRIGAEIFATAGSPQKRSYLKSLGIKHIMDSRSLTFADEIMEATCNEGVDVVLNSLAGESTTRSLTILRHGGRFIELGKTDILSEEQLTKFPAVMYYPIDVGEEVEKNPDFFGAMLKDIIEELVKDRIKCPPIKVFSFERVIGAFHFMEAAGHIGKIVLTRNRFSTEGKLNPSATYLITGGLGGLGLLFAEWMAKNGAGCIVLTSRRPPDDATKKAIEALEEMGAEVIVELGDVSNQQDVKRILAKIVASSKPLRGVMHAAGLLDDGVLLQQSWDKFNNVFAPKVFGSFNLHLFTQDIPLDFLILFSSAAALLGMPGQGNHAAANAFMDGLANYRMARGLRTISINWGAWAEVGAAATEVSLDHIQSHGLDSMSNAEGLASFEKTIRNSPAQIAVIPMRLSNFLQKFALGTPPTMLADLADRESVTGGLHSPDAQDESDIMQRLEKAPHSLRHNQLLSHVIAQVRIRLKIDPSVHIDPQAPLIDLGLDSLLAIELRNRLSNTLGLSQLLPATLLFDYPNAESITNFLIKDILFPTASDNSSQAPVENGHLRSGKCPKKRPRPFFSRSCQLENKNAQSVSKSSSTEQLSPLKRALIEIREMRAKLSSAEQLQKEPIAIIGMGCRFPGGIRNPETLWQILKDGVDTITEVPPYRWNIDKYYDPDINRPGKIASRFGGFVGPVDQFDAQFFGISPREAVGMDPQQRLVLEVAWEALEYSAIAPSKLIGSATGVFIGVGTHDYCLLQTKQSDLSHIDAYTTTGSVSHSVIPGRLAYLLGFRGPAVAVDTACSSSLVAVHLACQSLRNRDSDMALAGGVGVILDPNNSISLSKTGLLAPDGHCKAFDAAADGFVRSEGCGIVVLKRLSDALSHNDNIMALIKGSAINQDGRSNGMTAPNGPSQVAVIRAALKNANIEPSRVSYIETHGTGTSLGDPIEVQALGEVYGKDRTGDDFPYIGSVKTNLGHMEAAAGVGGLIKTVLALQHKEIPSHLHFKRANPHIPWDKYPFKIPVTSIAWETSDQPRVAGISAFGFSGTNVHVLLEQANELDKRPGEARHPLHLLCLSANTETALKKLSSEYSSYLGQNSNVDLADLCATANAGRAHFLHRIAIPASSVSQAVERLGRFAYDETDPTVMRGTVSDLVAPRIAFLYTGQGGQYAGMGRILYETEPVFKAAIDQCDHLLARTLDISLRSLLYSEADTRSQLDQTMYTQPAMFAFEYALTELWRSWGISPDMVAGHSLGEYVAACVAGVFSLEDGLRLVAERGRLIQTLPDDGSMAAVFASPERIISAIAPFAEKVAIAAINGPDHTVISGRRESVAMVVKELAAEGISAQYLTVSHAFHSPLMDPILDSFEAFANRVAFAPPRIGLITNVTGKIADADEITNARYWRRHLRSPVKFKYGMESLLQSGIELFVEIGPHPVLLGMARQFIPAEKATFVPSLRRERDDWEQLVESMGVLYVHGLEPDWQAFTGIRRRSAVALPTYPFERERYWFSEYEPLPDAADARTAEPALICAAREQSRQVPVNFNLFAYPEKWRFLDALTTSLIVSTLLDFGLFTRSDENRSLEEVMANAGIVPTYRRLIARWLEKLTGEAVLERNGDGFVSPQPLPERDPPFISDRDRQLFTDIPFLLEYIERCGEMLQDVLTGKRSPLDTLFPGGSFETADNLYHHWGMSRYFNAIAGSAIRTAAETLFPIAPIRVLEIGAGTGGMTASLLPQLPANRTQYHFTDVSDIFLNRGKALFPQHPFIRYGLLDIEKNPDTQGFARHSMDIVVAANVLHATCDLHRTIDNVLSLMAPGALLILFETTYQPPWFDISFGLIEGWQKFEDQLRKDHPLITASQWEEVLVSHGLEILCVLPEEESLADIPMNEDNGYIRGIFFQRLILARSPLTVSGSEDKKAIPFAYEAVAAVDLDTDKALSSGCSGPTSSIPDVLQCIQEAQPKKKRDVLINFIRQMVNSVLRRDPNKELDRRHRLMDLGLDSLMAVELRNRLERGLGLSETLPATLVFDYPTCDAIADYLMRKIMMSDAMWNAEDGHHAIRSEPPVPVESTTVEMLKGMTDEEVEHLMKKKFEEI